jgi:hypothetical protein
MVRQYETASLPLQQKNIPYRRRRYTLSEEIHISTPVFCAYFSMQSEEERPVSHLGGDESFRQPEHDREKACPGRDPGWAPVPRRREARFGGRSRVGKIMRAQRPGAG